VGYTLSNGRVVEESDGLGEEEGVGVGDIHLARHVTHYKYKVNQSI